MKLYADHRRTFRDPHQALSEGLIDLSDDLRVERLLEAYSFGIFPWPQEDLPTLWFCPEERGILEFENFHVARSLYKSMNKSKWTLTFNADFEAVIDACSRAVRPGQRGTWITPVLRRAYLDFHRAGFAHSVEVRDTGGALVGGLYGVYVAGLFCGESMFFKVPNASKFALVRLTEILRAQGQRWMDIQMVTPALEAFGGKYIERAEFLRRLESGKRQAKPIVWPSEEVPKNLNRD